MLRLAIQGLRHRASAFVASFIAFLLGAMIVMTFASMLDTASGDAVTTTDRETLVTMASIVGGFGVVIVGFAVTSTLTLAVSQRASEMAVLKQVGATPAQIGRMIVGEAVIVALAGGLLAILPAMLGGWLLLQLLATTDQVTGALSYRFGPIALGLGLAINLVAAVCAAILATRAATRKRATEAMRTATLDSGGIGRGRKIAAVIVLALSVNLGVVTATVFRGEGSDAMQTAGQASIWASIGFALLAPLLVRGGIATLGRPLSRVSGASGELALTNLRRRSRQMAQVVVPIILFTGIATGTLYMQTIENDAASAEGVAKTLEQRNIETLNYVVVGMIVLFAAIMLVNTLIAATTYRKREFGQQRLAGSTPRQVLAMVVFESIVLAVTGVIFGSIAALATVLPYTIARTGSAVPDAPVGIWLGVVVVSAVITLAVILASTASVIRVPAVEAVAT